MANDDIVKIMQEGFGDQPVPPTLNELIANRYMHTHVLPAVKKHAEAKFIASVVHYIKSFSVEIDPTEKEKLYAMHFFKSNGPEDLTLKEELFTGTIKVVELGPSNFRVDAVKVTDEGTDAEGKHLTRFTVVAGGSKNYFVTSSSDGNYLIHAKD